MDYKEIVLDKADGIATITLNRPDRLNVYTSQMGTELLDAFKTLDVDDGVRVVVITGAGRAFCAGADVNVFARAAEARKKGDAHPPVNFRTMEEGPVLMRSMGKPIIASINGPAVGIGFTLALACDIRLAADVASLGAVFTRIGVSPEFGSTYFLPRLVGIARACELVFTARVISAAEAKEMGLVNRVVPAAELKAATMDMARSIAHNAPIAIRLSKKGLYQGLDADLATQVKTETSALSYCFGTEDHAEGIRAFLEKRPPRFLDK
ncbi:MAG: enoyl-CoA hydratase/isomerase family protein [Chloroflexi bacterium]|nr:enoyl-CoA hydratase/isomerase family protein [Chloroflexota bacterium]